MCIGCDMVCALTLADFAVPNILHHGKILRIIATSESVANSLNVGSDVSLEMIVETKLRAVGAIALGDLWRRNQYEIHRRCSTRVKTKGKRVVCLWGDR
jgi:hypothetical protein